MDKINNFPSHKGRKNTRITVKLHIKTLPAWYGRIYRPLIFEGTLR